MIFGTSLVIYIISMKWQNRFLPDNETPFIRWGYRLQVNEKYMSMFQESEELDPESIPNTQQVALTKSSKTSSIYLFTLQNGMDVYFKLDNTRGPVDFLKNLFRPSRSFRAWKSLRQLAGFGFSVPTLLLCGEKRNGPILKQSFLVTQKVKDATPLSVYCNNQILRKNITPSEKHRIIFLVANLIRRLHEMNVNHPDLNPANILLASSESPSKLYLLDADRATFNKKLSWRKKKKNLSQLNAAFESVVSLKDRLRFYLAYDPNFRSIRNPKKGNFFDKLPK